MIIEWYWRRNTIIFILKSSSLIKKAMSLQKYNQLNHPLHWSNFRTPTRIFLNIMKREMTTSDVPTSYLAGREVTLTMLSLSFELQLGKPDLRSLLIKWGKKWKSCDEKNTNDVGRKVISKCNSFRPNLYTTVFNNILWFIL